MELNSVFLVTGSKNSTMIIRLLAPEFRLWINALEAGPRLIFQILGITIKANGVVYITWTLLLLNLNLSELKSPVNSARMRPETETG